MCGSHCLPHRKCRGCRRRRCGLSSAPRPKAPSSSTTEFREVPPESFLVRSQPYHHSSEDNKELYSWIPLAFAVSMTEGSLGEPWVGETEHVIEKEQTNKHKKHVSSASVFSLCKLGMRDVPPLPGSRGRLQDHSGCKQLCETCPRSSPQDRGAAAGPGVSLRVGLSPSRRPGLGAAPFSSSGGLCERPRVSKAGRGAGGRAFATHPHLRVEWAWP